MIKTRKNTYAWDHPRLWRDVYIVCKGDGINVILQRISPFGHGDVPAGGPWLWHRFRARRSIGRSHVAGGEPMTAAIHLSCKYLYLYIYIYKLNTYFFFNSFTFIYIYICIVIYYNCFCGCLCFAPKYYVCVFFCIVIHGFFLNFYQHFSRTLPFWVLL